MITIRPARAEDTEALVGLLKETQQILDGVDYTVWTHPTLVMVRDEEIVGMIQALLGRPYAVITEVCIALAHQNKGYALKLMDAMELILRASGVTAYAVHCRPEHTRVIRALEARGAARADTPALAFLRRLT